MKPSSNAGLAVALALYCAQGWAQTVVPMKGQSPEQVQMDVTHCQQMAQSQGAEGDTSKGGGRLRGAAAGAAAGAAGAQVRGRQHGEIYDQVDDDVKQQYRQNQARETAAAGAVVGGSRQRQDRREQRREGDSANASAYTSCLQGKGYQVTP
ncbi:hypothetical protein PS627_00311 [Pseudomonas fluorescens]|uniref:YMGG-like glycine zipper-containing protein n=1 Tax=Pseudomonas fluorescens TaxID=294 RepID=UPI00125C7001|nr:YMGG-like glycine zipper-containing protein [Pseudomonas fluorescens]CAG8863373.1 hypothetical protein PS627_00311 [Pseudomonas fluorescens]VVQ01932.1 hypothetical protein PS910_03892 [Pseudomonas fluorescens]